MQNQLLEELSEECVCPLCLEIFEKPRLLPECGHCFCDRCLRHYAQSKNTMQLDCPLCKKGFSRDIDSLKIHIQLQNICDKLKKLNIPQNIDQPIPQNNNQPNTSTNVVTENNNSIQENPPAFNPEALNDMKDEEVQGNQVINHPQYSGMNNHQVPPYHFNPQQQQPINDQMNNQMFQYNYNPNDQMPQQNSYNPLQQGNNNQMQPNMQYGYNYNQNNIYNQNNNMQNQNNYIPNDNYNALVIDEPQNNNIPVVIHNQPSQEESIPDNQPGYIIHEEDEVSMIKSNIKKEQQKKRQEEGKGFWGNLASYFKGRDLNFREGCQEFECLFNEFVIEKDEVPSLVEKWFENLWFKPVGFSQAAAVQSSSCVQAFFPFRLFEVSTKSHYDGQVFYTTNKNKKEKSRYTSGYVTNVHRVLVFTSSQHHNIKKWVNQQKISLTQETTFKPQPFNNVIEGKICYPSFNYESAWEEARQVVDTQIRSECENHARSVNGNVNNVAINRIDTDYTRIRSQVVYFPLYLIQYNYNNEMYHCVVNGISGEVTGDRRYGTGVVGEIVSKGWSFISGLFKGSNNNNNNDNNDNNTNN